jgi:hypothetical protein
MLTPVEVCETLLARPSMGLMMVNEPANGAFNAMRLCVGQPRLKDNG